jgi:hypothetical protein
MVELYLHSPCLHGVVLNELSPGITLPYYHKFICLGPIYLFMVYLTALWLAETIIMNWKGCGMDCSLVIFCRQSEVTEKNHESMAG